nr:MAG TPA: hypothetical protein [Caudoviricetes sp.]DAO61327.1 MAG TPA: hypothetical protein [Caudoviricetes sp.]
MLENLTHLTYVFKTTSSQAPYKEKVQRLSKGYMFVEIQA